MAGGARNADDRVWRFEMRLAGGGRRFSKKKSYLKPPRVGALPLNGCCGIEFNSDKISGKMF